MKTTGFVAFQCTSWRSEPPANCSRLTNRRRPAQTAFSAPRFPSFALQFLPSASAFSPLLKNQKTTHHINFSQQLKVNGANASVATHLSLFFQLRFWTQLSSTMSARNNQKVCALHRFAHQTFSQNEGILSKCL